MAKKAQPLSAAAAGARGKIQPGRHREIQLMRPGRRKLFNRAAQQVFLEWFAATCNVKWSAERAGFNYKTVLRHRMTDPVFAEGWDRAVPQAYARLEAQQLETKRTEVPIGIEGDWDAPEMDPVDPQIAIQLLREHKRDVAGPRPGFGEPRKQGRRPTVATNAEVKAALEKRLKAFHARQRSACAKDAADEARPGKGGDENPPRHGEDLE
ncbi:MAG: hypothetical protein QOD42_156 [Sphingomonadales bacterium]|jgi:hypothetical protein|nr:hypothetical protein [Sphingomonadales bacterium]